ncbi:MAG: hypothetical protein GC157_09110 [Frankiales bacterium]|nr:hypothetical protein [Frankiales bacterium]
MSRGQAGALFALRWRMVRSPAVRAGLLVLAVVSLVTLVALAVAAAGVPLGRLVSTGPSAEDLLRAGVPVDRTGEVRALLPSAMLAFALFSVIAPLAAGGGTELIPESELVAYPVRVPTIVRLSLALTPLNIAWYFQVFLLVGATSYAVRGELGPLPPLGVLVLFLVACTTVGHALGWALVGVRRTRRGRVATWTLLGLLLGYGAVLATTGRLTGLLDRAPTVSVLVSELDAAQGRSEALPTVAVLLVVAVAGYLAAVRLAAWALRRPGDRGTDGPLARPVRRRAQRDSALAALVAVDRASVWRSPPLRRGLVILALLPVAAAAVASLPWSSIALLPPLVSSGAALLFGVNALALDGSGATWVATMPHDPALVLRSKARVVLEVVGGAVALVLVGSSVRAASAPTAVDLLCAVGASASCVAIVVVTCLKLSVTRPHRAELRSARDTPAPPGSMAVYSARLAGVTTLVGLVFSLATFGDSPLLPVLVTVALVAWSAATWLRVRRMWADDVRRAGVVATVSAG